MDLPLNQLHDIQIFQEQKYEDQLFGFDIPSLQIQVPKNLYPKDAYMSLPFNNLML